MKLALITASLLIGNGAFAETATYDLKGLHCGGCKASIEASVCKEMADKLSSCSVEQVNQKKQTGKLTLITKEGVKLDDAQVTALVSKAGEYTATRTTAAAAPAPKK